MSEWKRYKLGEILTFQRGHDLSVSNAVAGIYPIAGSSGTIGYHNVAAAKGPSLTLGRTGNIQGPIYYDTDFWPHNTILFAKEFKYSVPKYVYYLFKTIDWNIHNSGSAVPKLNRNHLHEIEISLPDLSTQQRIASILSSLDDKIELNRQMNQTLEEMARAMFKHYFVDGIDKENLPDGWRMGKLVEEFNIVMGQSPDGKSYNTNGDGTIFYQGRTDFTFRFPEVRMYTTEPKRMANKFDTLVSVRAPVGDVNMANEVCCIGRGLSAVQHQTYKPSYTYYSMLGLKSEFNKFEGEGTVFGSMNKDSFTNIEVIIPTASAIEAFEQKANPLDSLIHSNSQETDYLIATRDYLLPKLISGEIIPAELKEIEQAL